AARERRIDIIDDGAIGVEHCLLVIRDQNPEAVRATNIGHTGHAAALSPAGAAFAAGVPETGRMRWNDAPRPTPLLSAYMRPPMVATLLADQCSPMPPVFAFLVLKPR